jgi:hypothetical protein
MPLNAALANFLPVVRSFRQGLGAFAQGRFEGLHMGTQGLKMIGDQGQAGSG